MRIISNNRGIMTIDFMFAIIICFGLSIVLFALSFTLVMVEATQYIAFSAARAQAAGGVNPDAQENAGRAKYSQLVIAGPFKQLYKNGWFVVTKNGQELDIRSGADGRTFYDEYGAGPKPEGESVPFTGVRIPFQSRVLNIRIPFVGSTGSDDEKAGFSTMITGFLTREPSVIECQQFMENRFQVLKNLDARFAQMPVTNGASTYAPIEDNGC